MKGKYIFVLLLSFIFVTACNQTKNEESTQTSESLAEKEQFVLDEKKVIEVKFEQAFEPDPEPEPEPEPEPKPKPKPEPEPEPEPTQDETEISNQEKDEKKISAVETETGLYIVSNPNSYQVYLNKNRRLPVGHYPSDLVEPDVSHTKAEGDERRKLRAEAATALEKLFSAAFDEEELELAAISGYRSNQLQATLYNNSVARNGQAHADQFSARPGTSEHESGLAMDISAAAVAFALEQVFQDTDEGRWLSNNAHHYGFIIRYPKGKEAITGYAYEPWHVRYVGNELAKHLYHNGLTLEEYFGYHYELN